ncbi:hypothetical protein PNOK_0201600 [Pyrrhoderma noxium]|uniref:Uncharacterized protein n=1 Tax=Pyrrhoderma noxium TaxID=2282107 RepID=A0A286UR92_9AGAM|nr:hypothetical protein PNOK_0201600 [Pyrrhoderma noxium]
MEDNDILSNIFLRQQEVAKYSGFSSERTGVRSFRGKGFITYLIAQLPRTNPGRKEDDLTNKLLIPEVDNAKVKTFCR